MSHRSTFKPETKKKKKKGSKHINKWSVRILFLGVELCQRSGRDETCEQARIHCIPEKVSILAPVINLFCLTSSLVDGIVA
jgi:hypothetical protein